MKGDIGDYGYPYLCNDCYAELGYVRKKCKLCDKTGEFKPGGFKEHRRFLCPNCSGYAIPWRLRHFGNKYHGYPKWVSEKDWNNRKYAPELAVST